MRSPFLLDAACLQICLQIAQQRLKSAKIKNDQTTSKIRQSLATEGIDGFYQGPAECELAVTKLLTYLRENYDISVIDTSSGYYDGTYRSVRLFSEDDLSEYLGSVKWVCPSPYRPTHKRKNWFIDFSACPVEQCEKFDPEQIVFETFRSGGKGGQNVNKVETGVRAIYLPTGQAVVCTEERSQYANKQKAIARLRDSITQMNRQKKAEEKNDNWRQHTSLERGNAGTEFRGPDFRRTQ